MSAIGALFDRVDGKPTETHKVELDKTVTLVFVPCGQLPDGSETHQDGQGQVIEGQARVLLPTETMDTLENDCSDTMSVDVITNKD